MFQTNLSRIRILKAEYVVLYLCMYVNISCIC